LEITGAVKKFDFGGYHEIFGIKKPQGFGLDERG